jgi:hypothetical protein
VASAIAEPSRTASWTVLAVIAGLLIAIILARSL